MSKYLICFCAFLIFFSCSRDYIEVSGDDDSSDLAFTFSTSYVNVDSIDFNIQYNDMSVNSIQIRKDTAEIPPTVYDGDLVLYDRYFTNTLSDENVTPNVTYYYSLFYELIDDSDYLFSTSFSYTTLSYYEGMHQTISELITYIDNKGRGLEIILSGETMDLYDDDDIISNIDGILITSLNYDNLDSVSPSQAANLLSIESFINEFSLVPVFAVDYTTDTDEVDSSRETFYDNGIVGFNRSIATANISDLDSNLPTIDSSNTDSVTALTDVQNLIFLDQPIDDMKNQLLTLNYDLIIMTPFNSYPIANIANLYSESEISLLQDKPEGDTDEAARLVYAYLDIGLAIKESYYWDDTWVDVDSYPDWILEGYDGSSTDYSIKYWSSDWKTILYAMIDAIADLGYDGIVIGGTHHYQNVSL